MPTRNEANKEDDEKTTRPKLISYIHHNIRPTMKTFIKIPDQKGIIEGNNKEINISKTRP